MNTSLLTIHRQRYGHMYVASIVLAIAFFFCGFMIVVAPGAWPFAVFAFGASVAIIQLAAVWSVFCTGRYLVRGLLSLGLAAIPAIAFSLGIAIAEIDELLIWLRRSSKRLPEVLIVIIAAGFSFPLLWAIAQLPSWLLRVIFNWHFSIPNRAKAAPVTILDFMLYTGFVAFGLGLHRFGYNLINSNSGQSNQAPMFGWLIQGSLGLLGVYVLMCLPMMYWFMRQRAIGSKGCGPAFIYFLVITATSLGLIFAISRGSAPPEAVAIFLLLVSSLFATFSLPIMFSRQAGFVLRIGKPKDLAEPPADHSQF